VCRACSLGVHCCWAMTADCPRLPRHVGSVVLYLEPTTMLFSSQELGLTGRAPVKRATVVHGSRVRADRAW
jgi:hypothetical protein